MATKRVPLVTNLSFVVRPSFVRDFYDNPRAVERLTDYAFAVSQNPFFSMHLLSFSRDFRQVVSKIMQMALKQTYVTKPAVLYNRLDSEKFTFFIESENQKPIAELDKILGFSLTMLIELEYGTDKTSEPGASAKLNVLEKYFEELGLSDEKPGYLIIDEEKLSSLDFRNKFASFMERGIVSAQVKGAVLSTVLFRTFTGANSRTFSEFLTPVDFVYSKFAKGYEIFAPYMKIINPLYLPFSNDIYGILGRFLLGEILLDSRGELVSGKDLINEVTGYYRKRPQIAEFISEFLQQKVISEKPRICGEHFYPFGIVPVFNTAVLRDLDGEKKNLLESLVDAFPYNSELLDSYHRRFFYSMELSKIMTDNVKFVPYVFAEEEEVYFCAGPKSPDSQFISGLDLDELKKKTYGEFAYLLCNMNRIPARDEEGVSTLLYKYLKESVRIASDRRVRNLPVLLLNGLMEMDVSILRGTAMHGGAVFTYFVCGLTEFFVRGTFKTLGVDFEPELASSIFESMLNGRLFEKLDSLERYRFSEHHRKDKGVVDGHLQTDGQMDGQTDDESSVEKEVSL